jgi:hypothetical protein
MSKPLNVFFRANPQLNCVLDQAQRLRGWQLEYERVAPPSLVRSSRVGSLDNGWLTIMAESGAVAAKLRQFAPELLHAMQAVGCPAQELRVRVAPGSQTTPPRRTTNRLGIKSRREIQDFAENLPDSPLRRALERLLEKA